MQQAVVEEEKTALNSALILQAFSSPEFWLSATQEEKRDLLNSLALRIVGLNGEVESVKLL